MYRSSPLRRTMNTGYITGLDMCKVCSSPLCSTLNTGYITGLDMCKVCIEAVHWAALWTCVQVANECHHPHPTPPHPIPCDVCAGDCGVEKRMQNCTCDSSLCARVTLENGCVRTWLQSVCLCVLVTPECVRGWPPDQVFPQIIQLGISWGFPL